MNKLCFVGLLTFSACCILSFVHADDCEAKPSNLGLCHDLQLLEDLAPRASVHTLIQNHMKTDIRFRKAVQYMQSSEFKKTLAKLDATATFQSFLRPFTRAGVNITDINSVGKIFDCLVIPDIEEATGVARSSFFTDNIIQSRSLDTFFDEVVQLIPRNEFVQTLNSLIDEDKDFAKFYKVARNPTYRSTVTEGFNNRDISRPIKQLRRNQIDLCKLVEIAFNILYWGPAV